MRDESVRLAIDRIAEEVQTPPLMQVMRLVARDRRRRRAAATAIFPAVVVAVAVGSMLYFGGFDDGGESGVAFGLPYSGNSGAPPTAHASTGPRADIQRAGSYETVASLVADSSLVALVTASPQRSTTTINGLPFTTTVMHVDRVLRGSAPAGTVLPLRQIASTNTSDETTLVTAGHQYVAFLGRVSFSPGTTTGEWYVVGLMAGLYEVADGKVNRLDDVSTNLPTGISLRTLESAVAAAPTQRP